jgi:hypothetical protein
VFDTIGDLDTALASEARADARTDFASFPEFQGSITHQAMVAAASCGAIRTPFCFGPSRSAR